jgi:putative lipoic acid-binding regulatory protein
VLRHAPDVTAERVRERPSSNGNFLSISYLVPAVSAAQIEALVTDLRACEGVVMLL